MRIVEVTWEDAAHVAEWDEIDPLPSTYRATTVGYLISRDKKRVIVAHDRFDQIGKWRAVTVIPIGMVRRVRVLGHA